MFRQIVRYASTVLTDLRQRLQHFKKSPPQFNSRKPMKRPKPKS